MFIILKIFNRDRHKMWSLSALSLVIWEFAYQLEKKVFHEKILYNQAGSFI